MRGDHHKFIFWKPVLQFDRIWLTHQVYIFGMSFFGGKLKARIPARNPEFGSRIEIIYLPDPKTTFKIQIVHRYLENQKILDVSYIFPYQTPDIPP